MIRPPRILTGLMFVLALAGCTDIPNLGLPGGSLSGTVSGSVTPKTKVAILEGEAVLDFTDAKVLTLSNGQFNYALPSTATTAVLAAFEDENGNNRWDQGEAITSDPTSCSGCSYL